MARLNPKRRAQLRALKEAGERNPSTQVTIGHVRSIWNDPAKVHRAKEQHFKPDRMRPTGLVTLDKGLKRWAKS